MKLDFAKIAVVDIETLSNMFLVCVKDYRTGAKKEFVIFEHDDYKDEALNLFKFLRNCVNNGYTFVTFNGVSFDMNVLHYFYEWCSEKQDPLYQFDNDYIARQIYEKAQQIINIQDNFDEKFKVLVQEKDLFLPTIDLFLQLHYDRKKCSLKWVEFSMNYLTIQDMPIEHTEHIIIDDVPTVISYCWNDVDATYEFFNKVKFETELRQELSDEFKLNLINASEPKMVRDIFGKFISKEMGITYNELKKLKTIRKEVKLKDIVLPYVKYQTQQFKDVLNVFNNTTINCSPHDKPNFEHIMKFQDMDIVLALGGIHACINKGVYTPTDNEVLEDADVTSFYPMLAIRNNLCMSHLGESFLKVYMEMFNRRQQYLKSDPRNYVYKIILNSKNKIC